MQLHEIKLKHKNKKRKRIGRGGKRGTYSGRGLKGQKSRAGGKPRPVLRDVIKKIPKKRGYKFKSIKEKPQIINLSDLEKNYKSGEKVTPETLLEKKLIVKVKGKIPEVKILRKGRLTKKLEIKGCKMSESVSKITKPKHQITNKPKTPNSKSKTV